MSTLSTHVLDTAGGRPAAGVDVELDARGSDGEWRHIAHGTTDDDGRVTDLLPDGVSLSPGTYRLTFDTGAWHAARSDTPCFYPEVPVVFSIGEAAEHYHVPLLLSPYGYSTYRGS